MNSTEITIHAVEFNGTIDKEAAKDSLFAKIDELMADRASYRGKVAHAVTDVFDRHQRGTRFLLNHLLSKTIEALDVKPEQFSKWEDRVLEYVRSNSKGEESLYVMGKGSKNGGVGRRADLKPTSEPADMAAE